jgi:hypothetical protein
MNNLYPACSFTILVLICYQLGCSSTVIPDAGESTGQKWITAYIPYVEEVILPEDIYAGEDFFVTLWLSSMLEPRLLKGEPRNKILALGVLYTQKGTWCIEPWMGAILPDEGPIVDQITIALPGLPPGEWEIGVVSPKTRELGGMSAQYEIAEGGGAYSPDVETRIYPISVIERPET